MRDVSGLTQSPVRQAVRSGTPGVDTPTWAWITCCLPPFPGGRKSCNERAMRVAGAIAMMGALALLVAVVSYDPTPARVIVIAVCCALAGFFLGRRL
jgi:hypothetical protein